MSEAKYSCAFLATRIFHRLWVYHSRVKPSQEELTATAL